MFSLLRQYQKWIIAVMALVLGIVFTMESKLGLSFRPKNKDAEVAIRIGNRIFITQEVRLLANGIDLGQRQELGKAYDPAKRPKIEEEAANLLVKRAILALEAENLGISVSEQEVKDAIDHLRSQVDAEGTATDEEMEEWARRRFGSVGNFAETIHDELLALKASRMIAALSNVSTYEARDWVRYRDERSHIRGLVFDAKHTGTSQVPSEEAIEAMIRQQPEKIRAEYEKRADEFELPARVRPRQIMVRAFPGASDEMRAKALERIEAARRRIEAGESFAKVAAEVSEDPSRLRGGLMGEFSLGSMNEAFERALSRLAPGELSEPVQSPVGYHLLQLDERLPATKTPYREASRTIAREFLSNEDAIEATRRRAQAVSDAIAAGSDLITSGHNQGGTLFEVKDLQRRADGEVKPIGTAQSVIDASFTLPRGLSSTIYEIREGVFVLLKLIDREEPTEEQVAVRALELHQKLLEQRSSKFEENWIARRKAEYEADGEYELDLSALAAS